MIKGFLDGFPCGGRDLRGRRAIVAAAAGLVLAVGCSGGKPDAWKKARPATYPAKGLVTFKGSPVEGATVVFLPDSKPQSATAVTGADGRFVLRTFDPKDGAIAGKHLVTIYKTTEERSSDPESMVPPKITQHLPAKYADAKKSGLSAEVQEKGPNEFTFELVE